MLKTCFILFLIIFISGCKENEVRKRFDGFRNAVKIEEENIFFIPWDQCDSCHEDFVRMALKGLRMQDTKVVIVSRREKNVRSQIESIHFSRIFIDKGRDAYTYQLVNNVPILYYQHENEGLKYIEVYNSNQITQNE